MKARLVEIIYPDGTKAYQIQQRHFLFRWWWVPAWVNSWDPYIRDTFTSLDDAKSTLALYNGPKKRTRVIE